MSEELAAAGVSDYSIFLDEGMLTFFAVQKLSNDRKADQHPDLGIVKKWWAYLANIMDTNPDNSPVWVSLGEVFHAE